ncbi:MAG: hypothetical protein JO168_23740 [Solirubrobacterales bacterium]|nr:hypothetical protein [Solirubrobacterales bacterium]
MHLRVEAGAFCSAREAVLRTIAFVYEPDRWRATASATIQHSDGAGAS